MSKGNAIQIVVDDAAATYPLTIDPWLESAILHASDAQASDFFGRTVAVSGDTAVIGAPYEDGGTGNLASDSGVAYVFGSCIRSTQSGSWSSTTTWAGGVAPVGADGVCVLNGHTVTLGATVVQVMGNTAVCNNNDSGNYRNRCFMENSANSGSATLTLHSTSGEDDIADDTFFQIRFCPGASCNDAVGGGGTCAGTATFASPAYFLIGSQGSSPTAVTL
ncbi:MAG: hypothetical protein GY796_27440 [Chloroflexi bacterium]|nr:hypothetical protein [Chloroflexota bacterium]